MSMDGQSPCIYYIYTGIPNNYVIQTYIHPRFCTRFNIETSSSTKDDDHRLGSVASIDIFIVQ